MAVIKLQGSPDERSAAALAQFVDRGAAPAGPGHRACPFKRRVRLSPIQTDVISLRHHHMRTQAVVEQNHDVRSATPLDQWEALRSSSYRWAMQWATVIGLSTP